MEGETRTTNTERSALNKPGKINQGRRMLIKSGFLLGLAGVASRYSLDWARGVDDSIDGPIARRELSDEEAQVPGALAESIANPFSGRPQPFYEGGRRGPYEFLYWLGRTRHMRQVTSVNVQEIRDGRQKPEFISQISLLFQRHMDELLSNQTLLQLEPEMQKKYQLEAAWRAFASLASIYNPGGARYWNYQSDCLGVQDKGNDAVSFFHGDSINDRGFFGEHPISSPVHTNSTQHPIMHAYITFSLLYGHELGLEFEKRIPRWFMRGNPSPLEIAQDMMESGGLVYELISTTGPKGLGYDTDKQISSIEKIRQSIWSLLTRDPTKLSSGIRDPNVDEDFKANKFGFLFAASVFSLIVDSPMEKINFQTALIMAKDLVDKK